MNEQHWLNVPESVHIAYDFLIRLNEAKMRGLRIDGAAALAGTASAELLRAYFDRMCQMVNQGHFDPDHIMEAGFAFQMRDPDGEEEGE